MLKNYQWATLVTIYRNGKILDVDFSLQEEEESEDPPMINGVNIRILPPKSSVMGPKEEYIECSTLLLCMNYQCDVDVFTAVNESGLVYDGGVVVNEVRDTITSIERFIITNSCSISKQLIHVFMLLVHLVVIQENIKIN